MKNKEEILAEKMRLMPSSIETYKNDNSYRVVVNECLAAMQDYSDQQNEAIIDRCQNAEILLRAERNAKSQWISISERLPEIGEEFDCWSNFGFRITNVTYSLETVGFTHWMPLPKDPKI